jgi:hypothetical protein
LLDHPTWNTSERRGSVSRYSKSQTHGFNARLSEPLRLSEIVLWWHMPIRIDRLNPDGQALETIVCLCEGCWTLAEQGEILVAWLTENSSELPSGDYVADIGFIPRKSAMGGGASLPPTALRRMADLGMSLYLSEYPAEDEVLAG